MPNIDELDNLTGYKPSKDLDALTGFSDQTPGTHTFEQLQEYGKHPGLAMAQSLGDTATFGALPYALAGEQKLVNPDFKDTSYMDVVRKIQDQGRGLSSQNPVASGIGTTAGMFMGPGGLIGKGAEAIEKGVSKIAPGISETVARYLGQIGMGAGTGAVQGAAESGGNLGDTAKGALFGSVVSGLGTAVGDAGQAIIKKGSDKFMELLHSGENAIDKLPLNQLKISKPHMDSLIEDNGIKGGDISDFQAGLGRSAKNEGLFGFLQSDDAKRKIVDSKMNELGKGIDAARAQATKNGADVDFYKFYNDVTEHPFIKTALKNPNDYSPSLASLKDSLNDLRPNLGEFHGDAIGLSDADKNQSFAKNFGKEPNFSLDEIRAKQQAIAKMPNVYGGSQSDAQASRAKRALSSVMSKTVNNKIVDNAPEGDQGNILDINKRYSDLAKINDALMDKATRNKESKSFSQKYIDAPIDWTIDRTIGPAASAGMDVAKYLGSKASDIGNNPFMSKLGEMIAPGENAKMLIQKYLIDKFGDKK